MFDQLIKQRKEVVLLKQRRASALVVIVLVMAMLSLVVASSIRPVRDEADLATLRVETVRAFYASESGGVILMKAVLGQAPMPADDDSIVLGGQSIHFLQVPDDQGVAILEGSSGNARRVIEMMIQ